MSIEMQPIGFVHTDVDPVPRHWSVSDAEGTLVIDTKYQDGLKGTVAGKRIVVLFHFHKSPDFTPDLLIQTPYHGKWQKGVFGMCSPKRPNPIGLSVVEVLEIAGNKIKVKGIDMLDGTPILDIKPDVDQNG